MIIRKVVWYMITVECLECKKVVTSPSQWGQVNRCGCPNGTFVNMGAVPVVGAKDLGKIKITNVELGMRLIKI